MCLLFQAPQLLETVNVVTTYYLFKYVVHCDTCIDLMAMVLLTLKITTTII